MNQVKKKRLANRRRKARVRYRVTRAGNKLRLSVFRSLQHIYVQIIDDVNGKTLVAASTLSPELKGLPATGNIEAAQKVGEAADIIGAHPPALQLRFLQTLQVNTLCQRIN